MLLIKLLAALLAIAALVAQPEPTPKADPTASKKDTYLPEGVRVIRNLTYAQVGEQRLLLDVYLPEKAEAEPSTLPDARPVVIWIHGGAWEGGNKDDCPARFLVLKGYSVVSINYRLSDVAPFPAQIHDCKAAVRWVRGNAKEHGFDADHVGAWGASAGGHLVALLGTSAGVEELEGDVGDHDDQSSRVQAVCDWFGPTDLVKLCRDFAEKQKKALSPGAADSKQPTPSIFRKLLGGELDDKLELCKSANPIVYVDKGDAPVLIMHGDKDELVPLSQSEELVEALKKANVPVELDVIKNGGHGFWSQKILETLIKFFDENLKKAS